MGHGSRSRFGSPGRLLWVLCLGLAASACGTATNTVVGGPQSSATATTEQQEAAQPAFAQAPLLFIDTVDRSSAQPWLLLGGKSFLPLPEADAAGACAQPDGERVYLWLAEEGGAPTAALALGADAPQLFVFDAQRDCFVEHPAFVEVAPSMEAPLLTLSIDDDDPLHAVEVDLFADVPGLEVVSLGELGFRVDSAGTGPGQLRTGRLGVPLKPAPVITPVDPPRAAWEAHLRAAPALEQVALPDPLREAELRALDGAEVLQQAWDSARPLVTSSPDLDWPSELARNAEADEELDEITRDGEEFDPDRDPGEYDPADGGDEYAPYDDDLGEPQETRTATLTVERVPGGHLFTLTQVTDFRGACCNQSEEQHQETTTRLLRLRDGRVLDLGVALDSWSGAASDETASTTHEVESRERYWLAPTLFSGWVMPGSQVVDDNAHADAARWLERADSRSEWYNNSMYYTEFDGLELDGEACGVAIGSSVWATADLSTRRSWELEDLWLGLEETAGGRRLELEVDELLEVPATSGDEGLVREVRGALFESGEQRLTMSLDGLELLDEDGTVLRHVALPSYCTQHLGSSTSAVRLVGEAIASDLGRDVVTLSARFELVLDYGGPYHACIVEETVMLHRTRGVIGDESSGEALESLLAEYCADDDHHDEDTHQH